MMKAWKTVIALALTLCLLLAVPLFSGGCGEQEEDAQEVYKIGAVLSISGPAAPLGQPEQRSLRLLETQVNAEGGINGHPVEFIIEDDESDPAKASTAITKLITQDGVSAVIGSSTTGATLAMMPVAEQEEVPLVCCAAGIQITEPVNKWVFRTPQTDRMALERVLRYLEETLGVSKVAVLHDSNAFGTSGADELEKYAADYGIEVVSRESYGTNDTDMTGQLTKVNETDAEALVVWGTNPGPASIARNMQQLAITIPFVGSHGIANKKFIELAGNAGEGVVFSGGKVLIPESIPEGSEWRRTVDDFIEAYQAEYQMDVDPFAGYGWDAGSIVLNAMKKAGSDREKIRDEIEKTTKFPGVTGVFNYSATDHDGLTSDDFIIIRIDNGEWTEVKD